MANSKDEKVQELFKLVQEKKERISNVEETKWLTKGNFKFGKGLEVAFNLRTITDENVFINALAFLIDREKSFKTACEELELTSEFKWFGHTVEEWKTDFRTRISKIQVLRDKEELELLEARLDKLISPELRDQMELDEITKELSTTN